MADMKPIGGRARLSCLVVLMFASGSFASEFAFVQDGKPAACVRRESVRVKNVLFTDIECEPVMTERYGIMTVEFRSNERSK